MSSVNEIRSAFLSYFEKHGHAVLPSSPLVPRNDPTLMFTNAGMVQFKNVFTGLETREPPRAATSQKCVRAGGKHNDLDNVGYTARHHTFFEMLGNFSFGDYFKEEAIYHSWNLVTKDFDINPDKLLVTVYADDDEAFDLWGKIAGLPDEKIIRIGTSDNFWAMGDTGPCGPCSEIFYDHGSSIPGGPPGSPDEDGDRFIEIWNLVFMQYEQVDADNRIALPKPSIDTGMGLERLAALLQGKHDNYDTDLFQSLIAASVDLTGVPAEADAQASHRVIADHLRATSFLIADGVLPSNEGRGYVLRRIMRRAMRHAHLLGAKDPVLHRLVPALLREMGEAYPELGRARALISETLELEENRFKKMLDRGLGLLDDASKTLSDGDTFDGDVAFKLYDTYGFPLDLTQDALRSRAISVDTDAFDAAMERQRADARAAWAGSGDAGTDTVWFAVRDAHGASEFLGYDTLIAEGVLVAAVKDGDEVETLQPGEEGAVVVNQTPFYAESGGQQGDQGTIKQGDALFTVRDTVKRADGVFVHMGTVSGAPLKVSEPVDLAVDGARRQAIRSNHSATHLLHEALRETLGDHVAQKGSLVAPDRLRFDFSHPKPIEADELSAIENISNRVILQDSPVETRLMDVDSAIESGARALFGEKYGDEVRVVSMGDNPDGSTFSVELCGGTHVGRTGEIGLVRVVSEGAVAAGVRRVEALTGEAARAYLSDQDTRVKAIASRLKVTPDQALERVDALMEERRKLEREVTELKKQVALGGGGQQASAQEDVAGIAFSGRVLDGVSPKDLKGIADEMKRELGSGVVTLVATSEGKAAIVVGVTDDLTGSHSAVDLVRAGSAALGGKGGGGRPDMAQAGGPDASKAEAALEAVKSALAG